MKTFAVLAILSILSVESTMGLGQLTPRELAEADASTKEETPLTEAEIEALFLEDMEAGVGITIGEPDDGSPNESDRNLRGRRELQSSTHTLLCKNSDCQGGHVWVAPGRYGSMPWQIGNDALTRVYIPAGHTFTYYEHTNYQGWQATFGEPRTRINLYMGGHNDAVSSFIIRRF